MLTPALFYSSVKCTGAPNIGKTVGNDLTLSLTLNLTLTLFLTLNLTLNVTVTGLGRLPWFWLAVAVLGKNIWGPGPSSFGRQQRTAKRDCYRTKLPIKKFGGGWARFGGPVPPWPQPKTATVFNI